MTKSLIAFILFFVYNFAFSQVLNNSGVSVNIIAGTGLYIDGSAQVSTGEMFVDATLTETGIIKINGDLINNGTIGGNGHIKVYGDWINNNNFITQNGTVFLDGLNDQLITGNQSTNFYNLILEGSGVKKLMLNQHILNKLVLNHLELTTQDYTMFIINPDPQSIERTTGFISSTNDGGLSRQTNSTSEYIFPVGSSQGTQRYRPVAIIPSDATVNNFHVRFANINATSEGYDLSNHSSDICRMNELFYHRIIRTSGNASANLKIYFDTLNDGYWDGISYWNTGTGWQKIAGSYLVPGNPLSYAMIENWNIFLEKPYALHLSNLLISNLETHSESCSGANDGWVVINVDGGEPPYMILWNNTIVNDTLLNLQPGNYEVSVMDNRGCIYHSSFEILSSSEICEEPNVWVPNIFSPNGDGENDILYVYGIGIKRLEFSIYNRWGELIFHTDNINEGWDGTYKGKRCSPSVFVYLLDVTLINDKNYKFYGNITLVK